MAQLTATALLVKVIEEKMVNLHMVCAYVLGKQWMTTLMRNVMVSKNLNVDVIILKKFFKFAYL